MYQGSNGEVVDNFYFLLFSFQNDLIYLHWVWLILLLFQKVMKISLKKKFAIDTSSKVSLPVSLSNSSEVEIVK